ncbi:uncharacterized protein C8Q71DRAFT_88382 [Rhodofomes roseus]|uniref:Defect at low temperature protein 1 n=1 Tax=Rhodofomes roseus TaxID=34475 RepID=A0ABQ8KDA0_9APHY|nr:uncharacterized protein C8Q71DRAFT_88382 [Rhodofomes roseus]KAH9835624.1 hypothetical protein C8Q71DRAFT_88382 [Rhodofomes roseus]
MFSKSRGTSAVSFFLYVLVLLSTIFFAAVSCALLLSQAVRTDHRRTWNKNFNAVVIGAAYVAVALVSVVYCLKRRIAVHRRLQRISKTYRTLGRAELPERVHRFVQQEYTRACLITYESQPKDGFPEGWGKPGTRYAGVRFRTALLDTVREIDALAHLIIPRHPVLRPHARMLHHFRFILPLLQRDEDGLTPLHYYDSAIQLARHASREPTEAECILGTDAASEIKRILEECRQEMLEGSSSHLSDATSAEI